MSEEEALEAFIAARLPLMPVPVLPHILLHQATPGSGLAQLDGALGADEDAAPYWAHRWGGGLALAQWMAAFPQEVTRRRVWDLGCGSGIVGIAAALAGAAEICAVDCDPRAIVAARMNARANHVALQANCTDPLDGTVPDVDLLLVGDLFRRRWRSGQRGFLRAAIRPALPSSSAIRSGHRCRSSAWSPLRAFPPPNMRGKTRCPSEVSSAGAVRRGQTTFR
ncbi:MAG: 50S ribosomal protein L11 methyltransferase [Sphingobium sp.]|nr:50S ribosomal protein L11 methyltransferase [Sphingobium sp.]